MPPTTILDRFLKHCDSGFAPLMMNPEAGALGEEIRALIAERDRLQQTADGYHDAWEAADREIAALKAAKAPARPAPARKLRAYKGVTYRDGGWYDADGEVFGSVANLVWCCRSANLNDSYKQVALTDADHAPIYALKDAPYEPVETVEEVLLEVSYMDPPSLRGYATRLRAAVAAEVAP